MKKYVILADSTCDLSKEIREYVGMEDYLSTHFTISDGRDFPTTLDWDVISRDEFYSLLSDKKIKITTAPPSIEEYYESFKKYTEEGYSIISMSLSSKISSTFDFAQMAAKRVKEESPNADIYCYDTLRMSGGFGLLCIYAHLLKKDGKSFEEVIAWLEENKTRVHQMGPIDDLFFIARRGRITMGKAIMGSFAGVKPMGDFNADGYTTVLTKVKGMNKALDVTVRYVSETAENIGSQTVLIAHSDREQYAVALKEKLEGAVSPKKVFITDVFTGCGANVGPGMVGVYYLGGEISSDLEAEKRIMDAITGK